MKLSSATQELETFPDWLCEQDIKYLSTKHNETKLRMIRYKYTMEIMQKLKEVNYSASAIIHLSPFSDDNMDWAEIMIIGEELIERFSKLYIRVEKTYNDVIEFDIIKEYNYSDVVIPLNFVIRM